MKRDRETHFPWKGARRSTPEELENARQAIENSTGKPRAPRGRPPMPSEERRQPISIRLTPEVLARARRVAARRGVGYQTVINETLLKHL